MKRWTGFFREHRTRLLGMGRMLHLRRPTARFLEAVAHVTADPSEPLRAIVGLVNPTSRGIVDNITVSLYYAGLAPGATVVASVLNADAAAATSRPLPAASTRFVVGRDPAASLVRRRAAGQGGRVLVRCGRLVSGGGARGDDAVGGCAY